MKLITPEIVWHNKEPVLSAHFHRNGAFWRLVTGGADNDVKMWKVTTDKEKLRIVFISSLTRHTKAVNVVRFSPNGEFLASAGDDSVVYLWKFSEGGSSTAGVGNLVEQESANNKENWSVVKVLRGHLEDIYDLCWSPDSNYIISGSVDNTAIVWDVQKGQNLATLKEPRQYVQGVAWDPLGKFIATLSCDRNLRIYTIGQKFKCVHTVNKLSTPDQDGGTKQFKMWMDESLNSFFRRLTFTPDGSFLITPGGTFEVGDKMKNSTYVFARNNLTKPVLQLPGPEKPTVCVRCSPVLYELLSQPDDTPSLTSLSYRMVYAVASIDSVLLYDTQHSAPFAFVSNIHYAAITDMAWSNDGQTLVITSSDCYCSILTFEPGELGSLLPADKLPPLLCKQQQLHVPAATSESPPEQRERKSSGVKPVSVQAPGVENGGEKKSPNVSDSGSVPSRGSCSPPPNPAKDSDSRSGGGGVSPDNKPRRIRPTTIATFTSPKCATTNGDTVPPTSSNVPPQNTSPVLATRDQITPSPSPQVDTVPTTSQDQSISRKSDTIASKSQNGARSSSPSSNKVAASGGGPRRVNFITLSSVSSSPSPTISKDSQPKGDSTKPSQIAPKISEKINPKEQNDVQAVAERGNVEEPMEV